MSSNVSYADQAPGATGVDRQHPSERDYRLDIVDADEGIVRAVGAARRKIAVCGFAASSRDAAPFGDPEWEIWGLNQLYRHIPRATRWFDIHANWREDNVPGTDHPQWLAGCGIPVYMAQREPSIPTSVNYPLQRVIHGVVGADYFTSTVAFMLALAIAEFDEQINAEMDELARRANGEERESDMTSEAWRALDRVSLATLDDGASITVENARAILLDPRKFLAWRSDRYSTRELGIFGIDLIVGTEYETQKCCVEYLLGLAQARNITIRLPQACALLKQRWRYGYQTEPEAFPVKLSELKKREVALQNERMNLIARLQNLDGALQENGYWSQVSDLRMKGGTVRLNESTDT